MKKIVTVFIFSILTVLLTLSLTGCGIRELKLEYELNEDGESYTVTGIKGVFSNKVKSKFNAKLTIPDTYNGKPVTEIGDEAFVSYSNYFTDVTIGNNVNSIGADAFFCCHRFTSVTIPDSVTSIGSGTFYWCENLTSVTIGNGVTTIGDGAFYGCDGLTNIVIPDSVTSIDYLAFSGCTSLTSVTIGNGVKMIGESAFYECDSLASVVIGDSVETIGEDAFRSCDSLTDVYYKGSEEDFAKIRIGSNNENLTNANIHYNYTGE